MASSGVGGASVTSIKVVWGDGNSDNLSGTSTIATHTYSTVGSYNVTVTAMDNQGLSTSKSLTLTVTAPPPGTPLSTILLIAIPIIVIAAIAVVLLRRRSKTAATPLPPTRKK